ncbi:MAG: acetate--CoA ligase family protein [Desulfomonile tiedjei]|nr:acetate--CoA ligase family protein [Desulfomonile tiedjei]
MHIVEQAVSEGRKTLSEYESKQLLAEYGVPVTREILVLERKDLSSAAREIGFPLVVKGCSPDLSHKTEMGMIKVDVRSEEEAAAAFDEFMAKMNSNRGGVLVQEMVSGKRELMVGMTRDAQFGPCVMFGLGGIFTEILKDVAFRLAPLEPVDAMAMMQDIKGRKILEAIRGMEAVDLDQMVQILINVGRLGLENDKIKEVDVNPLIISKGRPVAVDALVVLE